MSDSDSGADDTLHAYFGPSSGSPQAKRARTERAAAWPDIVTVVKTIIVTCPVGEEPSEDDIKQLIKLALEDLECAVKCGGQANSLFSEMSKQLGQVTDAITPKAVQGIIETVTAVTGALPSGIF